MQHTRTIQYHSQGNSKAERRNHTLKNLRKAFVDVDNTKTPDAGLPEYLMINRRSVRTAAGLMPHFLNAESEMNILTGILTHGLRSTVYGLTTM